MNLLSEDSTNHQVFNGIYRTEIKRGYSNSFNAFSWGRILLTLFLGNVTTDPHILGYKQLKKNHC